jgi:glycosyltransferase involved in cell wall biosynthesis
LQRLTMHVLLLTYEFHPTTGGVAAASAMLAKALRDHLHARVSVVVGRTWWPWEARVPREEWEGMTVYRAKYTGFPEERPLRQRVRTTLFFLRVLGHALRLRPDIIIAQRTFDLGLIGGIIGRLVGARCFAYAHGPDDTQHTRQRPRRRCNNLRAMRWNESLIVTNTAFERMFRELDPDARIAVLPNAVDLVVPAELPRRHAEDDGQFHVACVGRMVTEEGIETKGFSSAIDAVRHLPHCCLHLFGDGPERERLQSAASHAGLSDRVRFHGVLPQVELHRELLRMDLFLHPALVEGLPMIVLEVMALGIPVVASAVGGLPDIISDGRSGRLVPPGDARAIVSAIDALRSDAALRSVMAEHARRHVIDSREFARRLAVLFQQPARNA